MKLQEQDVLVKCMIKECHSSSNQIREWLILPEHNLVLCPKCRKNFSWDELSQDLK